MRKVEIRARCAFRRGALAALALLLSVGTGKSQATRFDPDLITVCLDANEGRDCIGQAADACMEASAGGFSTAGMVGCLAAEHDWWDADLNASYRALRVRERALDADWPESPGLSPRPSGADALRDMQRAWIAFRNATCRYQELDWWGGSGASLIVTGCHLQMTAEQALALRHHLMARDGQ